jgi:hypothetical protein
MSRWHIQMGEWRCFRHRRGVNWLYCQGMFLDDRVLLLH